MDLEVTPTFSGWCVKPLFSRITRLCGMTSSIPVASPESTPSWANTSIAPPNPELWNETLAWLKRRRCLMVIFDMPSMPTGVLNAGASAFPLSSVSVSTRSPQFSYIVPDPPPAFPVRFVPPRTENPPVNDRAPEQCTAMRPPPPLYPFLPLLYPTDPLPPAARTSPVPEKDSA